MRTLILFIATLIASFLAALNLYGQDTKRNEHKADTLYKSEKSTCCEISIKKNSSKIATIYSFYVL
jgi:hypothetical protein